MQKNPKGGGKHQGKVEKPKEKALYGKMHRKIYCNFRPIGNVEGKINNQCKKIRASTRKNGRNDEEEEGGKLCKKFGKTEKKQKTSDFLHEIKKRCQLHKIIFGVFGCENCKICANLRQVLYKIKFYVNINLTKCLNQFKLGKAVRLVIGLGVAPKRFPIG